MKIAIWSISLLALLQLLLVMNIEKVISLDWRAVFVPAWLLVLSEFITATTLCHCAPIVHASTPRMVRTMMNT